MSFRFRTTLGLLAATVLASGPSVLSARTTGLPPSALPGVKSVEEVQRIMLPAVDAEALRVEDLEREGAGIPAPTRFAKRLSVSLSPDNSGTWENLADGSQLWRLRIASPGAFSLSLGLDHFDLPAGAAFWVHDPNGAWVQGPYTEENRNTLGGLWTAVVLGQELVAELHLPRGNIFHNALSWPFAEDRDEAGTWGVETVYENVFTCGSGARRGGAVSGVPGHNAAKRVLEML